MYRCYQNQALSLIDYFSVDYYIQNNMSIDFFGESNFNLLKMTLRITFVQTKRNNRFTTWYNFIISHADLN
jgi:hypothetical protein